MKRLILAQLPPPRFDFVEPGANIPLAAGFMVSQLVNRYLDDYQTEILDTDIVDIFGDVGLIRRIFELSPDTLALTLYLWNSQRSLFVASALKRMLPDLKVIVGGPEATWDNEWILNHPAVDLVVIGEGEPQFVRALDYLAHQEGSFPRLRDTDKKRSTIFKDLNGGVSSWWSLAETVYPYSNGVIGPSMNGSIFLETARGCPFKCKYCYYHKAFNGVSLYPMATIKKVLDFCYSDERDINEIYLMDPTFNARPGFREILRHIISKRNIRDIKIHTELRADLLTESDISLFKEAGLISAEIGLQSVNMKALALAGRSGDPDKVLRMAHLLKSADVDVTTGIILGLPGDTPESFLNTLDHLKITQAFSVIQPFTLSILPGSDFRRDSRGLDLKYDLRPPYHLKKSRTFNPKSMRDCLLQFEEIFGLELDYIGYPSLVDSSDRSFERPADVSYISKWIVSSSRENAFSFASEAMELASNPFTLWFKGHDISNVMGLIKRIVSTFSQSNPHTVLTIVFEFVELVAAEFLVSLLDATANPETYVNKMFFPLYAEGEIVSPNFLIVAPFNRSHDDRQRVEDYYEDAARVVWSCELKDILNNDSAERPVLLSDRIPEDQAGRFRLLTALREISASRPEEILFRRHDAQSWWNCEERKLPEKTLFKENILIT